MSKCRCYGNIKRREKEKPVDITNFPRDVLTVTKCFSINPLFKLLKTLWGWHPPHNLKMRQEVSYPLAYGSCQQTHSTLI